MLQNSFSVSEFKEYFQLYFVIIFQFYGYCKAAFLCMKFYFRNVIHTRISKYENKNISLICWKISICFQKYHKLVSSASHQFHREWCCFEGCTGCSGTADRKYHSKVSSCDFDDHDHDHFWSFELTSRINLRIIIMLTMMKMTTIYI